MKRSLRVLLPLLLLLAVALTRSETNEKGASIENAIVVKAADEMSGTDFEHRYIAAHYPGSHEIQQALTTRGGRRYDAITFATRDGKRHALYFDITAYFGKF